MSNPTAGRGDPYWYEWFVGLNEVVKLLDPSTGVESVEFQARGIKGWDDVVVRLNSGRRHLFQVKHTRAEDTLTFGDLVQLDADDTSLLSSLFTSWKSGGFNDGLSKCYLITNRAAGTRRSKTADGVQRPALSEFITWLSAELPAAVSIQGLVPKSEWTDAWLEWLSQISGGTGDEQLAFLRVIELLTDQEDLDGQVARVRGTLATAFGVPAARVEPLLDALHRALRKWTTGHPPVTAEMLCSELALPAEQRELAQAPPPPAPFFPSRVPVAVDLERDLPLPEGEPVFFLVAEPGAGKTSVLSWLANRRTDQPLTGWIGLRFFCFEPLRPENPFIAPDASRVRPGDLWFSLLSQLREGLRGRLRELDVPLRNGFLTWQEARTHVLRLASRLGTEQNRSFVIVVDGIDHAARAVQTMPEQTAEFFASLPGPDELRGTSIRLLVAGQPAESYAEQYPTWIVSPHPEVRKVELPRLGSEDIRALCQGRQLAIPPDQLDEVVRVIQEHGKGNTLATVFAVVEAGRVDSLAGLAARLQDHRMSDGLAAYYRLIWRHAVAHAGDSATDVDDSLVAALALARRGVTPSALAAAFSQWQKPVVWWEQVLESLGPLLTLGPDGYRLRHNDIRVFLSERHSAATPARRRRATSALADYYGRAESDRATSHLQLLDLLVIAGRAAEWPRFFTVEWVIEAGALGIESGHLVRECEAAIRQLPELRDWSRVVPVACAVQTLERLLESVDYLPSRPHQVTRGLPPFLPSEAGVRPLTQWSVTDLQALARDAKALVDAGEYPRAEALLRRWLEGVDLSRAASSVSENHSRYAPEDSAELNPDAAKAIERLGWGCGRSGWVPQLSRPEEGNHIGWSVLVAFETGYVTARLESPLPATREEFFGRYRLQSFAAWCAALRGAGRAACWDLVRQFMRVLAPNRDHLDPHLRAEAAAWAIRSAAAEDEPGWLSVVDEPNYGLNSEYRSTDIDGELRAYASIAFVIGWQRVGLNARDIAREVFEGYRRGQNDQESRVANLAMLRVAALLGKGEATRRVDPPATPLVTAQQMEDSLESLWGIAHTSGIFSSRTVAAELAHAVIDLCETLGGEFLDAAGRQAVKFASDFPVDQRLRAIWRVLSRLGRRDIQNQWLSHWLAESGEVWKLSREETHTIAGDLIELAVGLGEQALVAQVTRRLDWLRLTYRVRKEYAFSHVADWFHSCAALEPRAALLPGWRLWTLCDACDSQGGDNRYESDIRVEVSATALKCGVAEWWTILQSTCASGFPAGWHGQTRQLLVAGVVNALEPHRHDLPVIWSLALAFSYWHDEEDNGELRTLRDAMLALDLSTDQRRTVEETLQRTTRSSSLDGLAGSSKAEEAAPSPEKESPPTVAAVLEDVQRGKLVAPSVAAAVVRELAAAGGRSDDIECIVRSIGCDMSVWSHADRDVPESMDVLARAVRDDQLWQLIAAIPNGFRSESPYRSYGAYPNLLAVALARAKLRGVATVQEGLEVQLEMHARWLNSTPIPTATCWRPLPETDPECDWRKVAVRLFGLLFASKSAEAITAALEGLHAFVDSDPSVIPEVFAELSDEWSRYWLLHAAECWSTLHPTALSSIQPALLALMSHGSLVERLQSWIILCRCADAIDGDRPPFPAPAEQTQPAHPTSNAILFGTSGSRQGHVTYSDRYSAVRSMLQSLKGCGWNFDRLENVIASSLSASGTESHELEAPTPGRRGDVACSSLTSETVVGRAILPTLRAESCTPDRILRFAQGYLGSDEPWLQRCAPRRTTNRTLWPSFKAYDGLKAPSDAEVERSLRGLVLRLDVTPGWRTFAARAVCCSRDRDYVLRLWYESQAVPLRPIRPATCPSGRTFLWWWDSHFEPAFDGVAFVSALFVGGNQRLNHCHLEMQPPRAWATVLGWRPDPREPLRWLSGDEEVARYERIHGPLRDPVTSHSHRLPFVDRWLVTEDAFHQAETTFGSLRPRDSFKAFKFGEDE